jgi:hypothetical protein
MLQNQWALNEEAFNNTRGPYDLNGSMRERVHNINEAVDTHTLGAKLAHLGVPRHPPRPSRSDGDGSFLLLKVDIDSFDLEAFAAVVSAGFRPLFVYTETSDWAPLLRFAALSTSRSAREKSSAKQPGYARVADLLARSFGCMGVSLQMLLDFAPKLGYLPIQDDGKRDTLLVDAEALQRRAAELGHGGEALLAATNTSCFPKRGWPHKHNQHSWPGLLRFVESQCAKTSTPYTVDYFGTPCPAEVNGSRLDLRYCRSTVLGSES